MFSHDRIDAGSRLLAENLPDKCKGAPPISAPAGAICRPCLPSATAGLEGDRSLRGRLRVAGGGQGESRGAAGAARRLGFFWHDLVGEKVEKKYDLIVMNPPFHQGRAAEPAIGQAMIKAAVDGAEIGGRLFMVAKIAACLTTRR